MKIVAGGERYDTDQLAQVIDRQADQGHSAGITLLGVWKTPYGCLLVITDSVWASGSGDGTCIGVRGYIANERERARLADRYGGLLQEMGKNG